MNNNDVKKQFLYKVYGEENVDKASIDRNISSMIIELSKSTNHVKVKVVTKPTKPCDFKPVVESTRYKLQSWQCTDKETAKTTCAQGHADIKSNATLKAADYNNLACAAMWLEPPIDSKGMEDAREWFGMSTKNELGYNNLSPESKVAVQNNLRLATLPDPKGVIPLYNLSRTLTKQHFETLANDIGLRDSKGKPIEGFSFKE